MDDGLPVPPETSDIQGVTHALVNRSGRVTHQSDYWDASFPVYGEFPVVRTLMKAIRRMVRVHGS